MLTRRCSGCRLYRRASCGEFFSVTHRHHLYLYGYEYKHVSNNLQLLPRCPALGQHVSTANAKKALQRATKEARNCIWYRHHLQWRILCPFDTRRITSNPRHYPVSSRSNSNRTYRLNLLSRFPGQQKVGGDSKIPSVVCYDGDGNVVAVGSETDEDTNPELLEVEGYVRAEWYALHNPFRQTLLRQ